MCTCGICLLRSSHRYSHKVYGGGGFGFLGHRERDAGRGRAGARAAGLPLPLGLVSAPARLPPTTAPVPVPVPAGTVRHTHGTVHCDVSLHKPPLAGHHAVCGDWCEATCPRPDLAPRGPVDGNTRGMRYERFVA